MTRLAPALLASLPLALGACSEQADRVGEEAGYQGGDRTGGQGASAMSPAASALAERFDLAEPDLIIAPTTYRAQGDLSSGAGISVAVIEEADPGHLRVSGSADPDAVLANPGLGLSYRLSADRTTAYAGQTVIVTLVVRAAGEIGEGARPAIRAAWVAGPGMNSGWQEMVLTTDWQKAVFTYAVPEAADPDPDHIVILPPEGGQAFDLAALAVRPSAQ
ncbi:hypothetical protein E5163_03845 [Marinicauda algicola]|uniref:Lipoprotein n=1 Tax=Marinicauda algicola TaxID=2029849 RepID=A0A4S2H3R3_9PROT|nr:hypothetical protein [Marinicauda algicola]TGY90265.1 hypothetical protein E5163_03845 [Marinicauda algicola]